MRAGEVVDVKLAPIVELSVSYSSRDCRVPTKCRANGKKLDRNRGLRPDGTDKDIPCARILISESSAVKEATVHDTIHPLPSRI